jgi:hypothetical protein
MSKLTVEGKYKRFPGTTVVAPVVAKSADWKSIENFFVQSERLKIFYAALPAASYHVTICGCKTAQDVLGHEYGSHDNDWEVWSKFLTANEKENMEIAAKANAFGEVVRLPKFVRSDARRIFVVSLQFFSEDEMAVKAFSSSVKCQPSIPSHVTLAYQIRKIPQDDDVTLTRELAELEKLVERCFKQASEGKWLERARFCYFDDVRHFEPWDGRMNSLPQVIESCSNK